MSGDGRKDVQALQFCDLQPEQKSRRQERAERSEAGVCEKRQIVIKRRRGHKMESNGKKRVSKTSLIQIEIYYKSISHFRQESQSNILYQRGKEVQKVS